MLNLRAPTVERVYRSSGIGNNRLRPMSPIVQRVAATPSKLRAGTAFVKHACSERPYEGSTRSFGKISF